MARTAKKNTMSNFNWIPVPSVLGELADQITIGGETINGTGEVQAKFFEDEKLGKDMVFLYLDALQARALAEMLRVAAQDAEDAQG